MRVKAVNFGFTKNLPNFQSARADATIELNDSEDYAAAMCLAAAIVKETLDMPLDADETAALALADTNGIGS